LIEYNLASPSGAPSGLWDVHTRIGGFAGSNLQLADCPTTPNVVATAGNINPNCIAAFMSMHVTAPSSGLYLENVWLWVADHDIEDKLVTQITVYAGRGLLIESTAGSIWGYGTAVEHHQFYQYQFSSTQECVFGQIQTETAYYQPNPDTLLPFPANAAYQDPVPSSGQSGWGLRVLNSKRIFVYGAGLYSFFDNYNVSCSQQATPGKCQSRIFSIENSSEISVYALNTIGATQMITVDNVDKALHTDNLGVFPDSIILARY
jgi:hypothetical protein